MTLQAQDNPFDPSADNLGGQTPDLEDVILRAVDDGGRRLRVCVPCHVVEVRGNQLVDVQPSLQAQYIAEVQPTTLPVIPNVPVCMPVGQAWGLKLPLAVGDLGLVIFADRSIDNWSAGTGGLVDPADPRHHDLADAIFVPGLVPTALQTTDGTTDLVLRNGQAQIRLLASGKVHISNAAVELVDLARQLADAAAGLVQVLQSAQTLTMLGPQPFIASSQAQLAQSLGKLQGISANLASLKG